MSDSKIIKYFLGKVKSVDPKTFTAEVVISDETKDRYDERVLVSSFAKTKKEFMKHPVLLSSHAYRGLMNQLGVFESIKIDNEAKEVVAKPKWFVGEGNPEADWGWKLAEKGVAAFSIGFIPKKSISYDEEARAKNGGIWRDYEDIELLEVSQVLIPANPSALQKSFSDDDLFLKDLSDKIVEVFAGDTAGIEEVKWEDPPETNEDEKTKDIEIEDKGWEETDNEIRHRVREPENFEKFRTINIKKDKPKVNAIYGKVKEKDEWQIQSLRFPKADGWTMSEAKTWVKEHPDIVKFLEDIDFAGVDEEAVWFSAKIESSREYDDLNSRLDIMADEIKQLKEIVSAHQKELHPEDLPETKDKEQDNSQDTEVIGEEKIAELRTALMGKSVDDDKAINMFKEMTKELGSIFSAQQ